ncbi:hypothetical protein D3C75_1272590 [compost metagenome]
MATIAPQQNASSTTRARLRLAAAGCAVAREGFMRSSSTRVGYMPATLPMDVSAENPAVAQCGFAHCATLVPVYEQIFAKVDECVYPP